MDFSKIEAILASAFDDAVATDKQVTVNPLELREGIVEMLRYYFRSVLETMASKAEPEVILEGGLIDRCFDMAVAEGYDDVADSSPLDSKVVVLTVQNSANLNGGIEEMIDGVSDEAVLAKVSLLIAMSKAIDMANELVNLFHTPIVAWELWRKRRVILDQEREGVEEG